MSRLCSSVIGACLLVLLLGASTAHAQTAEEEALSILKSQLDDKYLVTHTGIDFASGISDSQYGEQFQTYRIAFEGGVIRGAFGMNDWYAQREGRAVVFRNRYYKSLALRIFSVKRFHYDVSRSNDDVLLLDMVSRAKAIKLADWVWPGNYFELELNPEEDERKELVKEVKIEKTRLMNKQGVMVEYPHESVKSGVKFCRTWLCTVSTKGDYPNTLIVTFENTLPTEEGDPWSAFDPLFEKLTINKN